MNVIIPLNIGLAALTLAVLPNVNTERFRYSATLGIRLILGGVAVYNLVAAYGAYWG